MSRAIESKLDAALEALRAIKPANLSTPMLADIGGQLKALDALLETTRAAIAEQVRRELRGRKGTLEGEAFRAAFAMIDYERIDVKALREKQPAIAAKFTITDRAPRVTFATR